MVIVGAAGNTLRARNAFADGARQDLVEKADQRKSTF
jgi:hypothetical protein